MANLSSDVAKIDRRVAHLLSQLKLHRSLNVALFEQASEQQQKLEENSQKLVCQVASVENALALQVILSGLLLCTVVGGSIGIFFKAVGVLMLWHGGKLLIKVHNIWLRLTAMCSCFFSIIEHLASSLPGICSA